MQVTIMFRNSFTGGDGWTYFPMNIEIENQCPICGGDRGNPKPYRFCEDGEWFTVNRWENPCGHLDTYGAVYLESLQKDKLRTGDRSAHEKEGQRGL